MGEVSNTLVCIMGMGVVFIGLICLVIICQLLRLCCMRFSSNSNTEEKIEATSATPVSVPDAIENREELIAAVSAVIAEDLGADGSGIRIRSFKRV